MISDGYGEDTALEDYLREREGLLRWKADRDDDAVQEARIKVWRTLRAKPGVTTSYLDQAASWRILEVLRGEALTGEERPKGGRRDALNSPWTSQDAAVELAGPDLLAASDMAYHHGEILQALNELPPAHRDYVLLRFWGGMDRTEIGLALGRNPGNLATTWRTQILPVLARKLAHLAGI